MKQSQKTISFVNLIQSILYDRHEALYASDKTKRIVKKAEDPGIFGLLMEAAYQLDDQNKASLAARIGVQAPELELPFLCLKRSTDFEKNMIGGVVSIAVREAQAAMIKSVAMTETASRALIRQR